MSEVKRTTKKAVKSAADSRPRVEVPMTALDWMLEAVALLLLVGLVVGAIVSYNVLPERIPVHFDINGTPDRWGSRSTVFMIPVIGFVVYGIMTGAGMLKPWYWNIPVAVTEENAFRLYRATAWMLRVVKIEAVAMIASILWLMYASAQHGQTRSVWFPMGMVGLLLLTVFGGIIAVIVRARPRTSA